MKRRTFDILMASAGLFLAVTLIAAGGLLTWASRFIFQPPTAPPSLPRSSLRCDPTAGSS
jgi:nitrate reductase NapE component